jgi:hypothetical protein
LLILPTSKTAEKTLLQALAGCRDCIQSAVLKLFTESKWGSQRCKIYSFKTTHLEQLTDTVGLLHLCESQLLRVTDTDRSQHPNKDSGLPSREHDYLIIRHRLQELTQPKYEILCVKLESSETLTMTLATPPMKPVGRQHP